MGKAGFAASRDGLQNRGCEQRSPVVELGPENSHPDESHFAEGRAEAVQQELVRVWPAACAAPEGAVQAQGLVCQESQRLHRFTIV